MPMFPTADADAALDPEERRRRRAANSAQAATNSTPLSQMAQQFSQPAGGNFQAAPPEPVSPLKGLVGGLARQQPTPASTQQGAQQSYQSGTAAGRDMSWMTQPGALQGPQGAFSLGTASSAPQAGLPGTFRPTPAPTPSDLTTQPVPGSPNTFVQTGPIQSAGANLNTDGYAAPQHIVTPTGGPMAGWDAAKWGNASHQTPKYGVGRVLSQFPPTVEGLQQAMPDIQKAYPGARLIGRDKVDIPGVGVIDVLQGSAEGGKAWQWLDEAAAAGGTAVPPMAEGAGATVPSARAADPYTQAGALELDPITGLPVPRSASPDLQALLSQLMGGVR